jgi:AcrR family transcriptional regulator
MNQSSTSPGRPGLPTTARGQLTRQKLLDAAEQVFGEKGFERASIVDITQRAGVAQGTFYVYFVDKKAVFVELVRELSHRLRQEIAEAVAGIAHRVDVEREGFRAFFAFICRHRNLYKIVRQAEFVDEEVFRWYYQRMADGYIRGLSRAMDQGQIRRIDPDCLMGISDYLGMRWVLGQGEIPPDHVFESMMTFIRRGMDLRPPADPQPEEPKPEGGAP